MVVSDDEGLELALELHDAGTGLSVVVDRRSEPSASRAARRLDDLGIPHLLSSYPMAAQGSRRVETLRVASGPDDGASNRQRVSTYSCDLVCLCSPVVASHRASQAGRRQGAIRRLQQPSTSATPSRRTSMLRATWKGRGTWLPFSARAAPPG